MDVIAAATACMPARSSAATSVQPQHRLASMEVIIASEGVGHD